MLNKNELIITGLLVESKLSKATAKNTGKTYIKGEVVVRVDDSLYTVSVLSFAQKSNGEASEAFKAWEGVDSLLNKRVRILGSLSENRYYSKNTNAMVTFQGYQGNFISKANEAVADGSSIKFQGFITKELTPVVDVEGKTRTYELGIGQAYARNDGSLAPSNYTFNVPVDASFIADLRRLYGRGKTVEVEAVLENVTIVQETKAGFGKVTGTPRTYRYVNIVGGSEPIFDETAYSNEQIMEWEKAYQDRDIKLTQDAQDRVTSGKSVVGFGQTPQTAPAAPQQSRTSRFINL